MFIRKLRSTDISKVYELNPNEQNVDFLKLKPHLHSSIGLFVNRELRAYALIIKKREETRTFHLVDFFSNSITHSLALFSRLTSLHQYSFEVHFDLPVKQVNRLETISRLAYGSVFSIENEENGMQRGKFQPSRHFRYKYPSLELLRLLYETNPMEYGQFNLPLKSILYKLLSKFSPSEIQRRESFILSQLHKRNSEVLKQFDSSMPMISIGNKKIYDKFKDSYGKALKDKSYEKLKENSSKHKYLTGGNISYFESPHYYLFHSEDKRVEIGNLIHFPSPYYEEKYAFFRKQLSFIRNSFYKREGDNTWFFLDYEGFKLFSAYEIPKNIYHFIPRNFQTIFRAVLKEAMFVENMFTLFKGKNESLNFTINRYFDFEPYYGDNQEYYRLFKLLFRISKIVGSDFILEYAQKININKKNFRIYDLNRTLDVFLTSNLLTAKAWEHILLKYSLSKQEQITKIISSIVSSCNDMKMEIPRTYRKELSLSIKKNEIIENILSMSLQQIMSTYIANQCDNKKEVKALTDVFLKLCEMITTKNIDFYLNFLNHYLKYQVKMSKDKRFEGLLKALVNAEKLSIISPTSINYYYFNVLLAVKEVGTKKFFETFIDEWTMKASVNPNPNRFIHDTGYIYEKVMRMHPILSKEVLLKIYSCKNYDYINSITDQIRFIHDNIRTYFHKNKTGKILFKKVLIDIEKAISLELPLDDIKDSLMNMINEKILEKYNLSDNKEFLENTNLFLKRMAKYRSSITLAEIFLYFREKTVPIISGTYEGLFSEKCFYLDQTDLGFLIKKALGDRNNQPLVSKPKKLYGLLSSIGNVSELIAGNIRPEDTNKILKLLKERRVSIPKILYKIPNLYGKIEPKCSPEFLVAGDASVCCMSFGEDNAISYALEKGFGVFNVYYNNRVIANSVLWINHLYDILVIDNIEVHPNYEHLNDYIREIYFGMIETTLEDYQLKGAVQGNSYNDLGIAVEDMHLKHIFKAKDVKDRDFYTDAHSVSPIETSKMSAKDMAAYLKSPIKKQKP